MPIITLTTDWKQGDYYLAALKGSLLALDHTIRIVDISHDVETFNLLQAVFILKHCYRFFKPGTIHLIGVLPQATVQAPMAFARLSDHYFVGPNDGRFSLLTYSADGRTVPLTALRRLLPQAAGLGTEEQVYRGPFSELPLFTAVVRAILHNTWELVTEPCRPAPENLSLPVSEKDSITGRVLHIDSYGNLITNIPRTLFERIRLSRRFIIYVQGPFIKITRIVANYSEAAPGETVALFNSLGLLEVALIDGHIARQEALDLTTQVIIKFL